MNTKIQPRGPISPLKSIDGSTSAADLQTKAVSTPTTADPVTAIAMELIEGKIDTTQAVDKLLAETMNTKMVAMAPDDVRREVEEILRDAISSEPALIALTQKLE